MRTKLLVLSALWLVGLGAYAANLVERTAPVEPESALIDDVSTIDKTAQDFVVGDAYVIYNKGAEKYYYQGNAWGTQATGSADEAMIVRFVMPNGKSLNDKALWLRNYVPTQSQWRTAFITTGDGRVGGVFGTGTAALFVDNNDGDAALLWVEASGDKTYRISISESNSAAQPEGLFLGIDANSDGVDSGEPGTAIMPKLAEGEGVSLDWEFYAVPEWTAYFQAKDIFDKSEALKKQIEAAEAAGIDVSAAVAVYNDANSSISQMDESIQALLDAMASGVSNGTAENPADATALIKNPNFDDASYDGWDGTAPNMTGSGSHGPANVAEHYNKTFDTYQTLTGLPNGVYAMKAHTFFRGTLDDYLNNLNQNCYPYLYAVTSDTLKALFNNAWAPLNTESMAGDTEFGTTASESSTVLNGQTVYIPNDPSAFRLYEERGMYETNLFFEVTDGQATLGIKKDNLEGTTDWAVFDTFTLKFYGNEAASFQKWVELSAPTFAEGIVCTASYLEAYQKAVGAGKATNRAEAIAAIEAIKAEAAPLQQNISLWNTLQQVVDSGMQTVIKYDYLLDYGIAAMDDLSEYCEMTFIDEVLPALALTNEELLTEIAKVRGWMEEVTDAAKSALKDGDDVTEYITNPGFENGTAGWTVVSEGGGNVQLGGNAANHCFEAWHSTNFDIYQEVKNLPVGVYELSVKGYMRYKDGTEAIGYKGETPENVPIYVYANDSKTQFANWFDYPKEVGFYVGVDAASTVLTDNDGYEYPDNMTAASIAFGEGGYMKSAVALVAQAGDVLRIGVKGTPEAAEFWPIWDDFHLTYRAFNVDVVKPALEDALSSIDLEQAMGKSVKEKAQGVQATALTALESGAGSDMFKSLSEVFAVNEEISTSVALFAKLSTSIEDLQAVISTSKAIPATISEANALVGNIQSGIEAGSLENEDAEDYLNQISVMLVKLGIPAEVAEASDENPIDLTSVIRTPSFENEEGTNSFDGWTGAGYNFGNDDTQKGALALEYWEKVFDLTQEIVGLPNGTYKLTVNAYERTSNPAFLYATSGEQTYSVELQALEESATINDMVSAALAFADGSYLNELIIKVTDEKLRIGIRKDENSSNDWVILDNFTLTYYGENSARELSGDELAGIQGVIDVPTVSVEFFTLDGRKVNAAQKGILIQKTIQSNGSVAIRKVRK